MSHPQGPALKLNAPTSGTGGQKPGKDRSLFSTGSFGRRLTFLHNTFLPRLMLVDPKPSVPQAQARNLTFFS
jgi:hypothetical protein